MASPGLLPHLWVQGYAETEAFHRSGGGNKKVRDVEHRAHGSALLMELREAVDESLRLRDEQGQPLDELRALGVVLVLEGADASYPLKLDSLQRFTQHRKTPRLPKWLLLSVTPATDGRSERAQVWVSDRYRGPFLALFEDYLDNFTKKKNPKNQELVANIGRIRRAVLDDLWQSKERPPTHGRHWWELWLQRTHAAVDHARAYAEVIGADLAVRSLELNDRTVVWIHASWQDLQTLPFTDVPLAEIRRPEFVDTIDDLSRDDQDILAEDLAARVQVRVNPSAPAVCHLDTGVRRSHALLSASLAETDVHSVVGSPGGADRRGHGTAMAGLALFGPLDGLLLSTAPIVLDYCLESVKLLPDPGQTGNDPLAYGLVTAQAVVQPEATVARPRVFCMPITTTPDGAYGEPTLWSASVDALAAGTDIGRADNGIQLLGAPDPNAARLFLVSGGNVDAEDLQEDYRAACDTSVIEDPAQSWNALTVGAYTDLNGSPTDPSFAGWSPLAEAGDVSPHSRTSGLFDPSWPIKPEICLEGGNILTDKVSDYERNHQLLSLATTDARDDLALGTANATSAATAQAARLAALVQVHYPAYWPETVRGLIVHAAEWTPTMRAEINRVKRKKKEQLALLRRYGWGVPTEQAVLSSASNAPVLVVQDEFVPFDGPDHKARRFRLHRLPWPTEALRDISAAEVTLRVTLSYFIEPTASRRGWRRRYKYASYGLRFELKAAAETTDAFLRRVNREAEQEEDGTDPSRSSQESGRWLVGKDQRNGGSLHQDIWEGTGEEMAACDALAVHPIGGWWKNNARKDRVDRPVRYALIISLKTAEQSVDLYTPIASTIGVASSIAVPGT